VDLQLLSLSFPLINHVSPFEYYNLFALIIGLLSLMLVLTICKKYEIETEETGERNKKKYITQ
jgi:hypothetical protein